MKIPLCQLLRLGATIERWQSGVGTNREISIGTAVGTAVVHSYLEILLLPLAGRDNRRVVPIFFLSF